jgi:hypothetical protein
MAISTGGIATDLRRWDGALKVAAGVTTMGGDNATVQQRIDEVSAGESLAPQIVPAGLIEGAERLLTRNPDTVTNPEWPNRLWYGLFPPTILNTAAR